MEIMSIFQPSVARLCVFITLITFTIGNTAQTVTADEETTHRYFESIKDHRDSLLEFLNKMPKGADLHTHLGGAIYAESFIKWALEDDFCFDMKKPAIVDCINDKNGLLPAEDVGIIHKKALLDGLSVRAIDTTSKGSGHDQFFEFFGRKKVNKEKRIGDMLEEVVRRAADQNVVYLEIMLKGPEKIKEIAEIAYAAYRETAANPPPPNTDPIDNIDWSKPDQWHNEADLENIIKVLHNALNNALISDDTNKLDFNKSITKHREFLRKGLDSLRKKWKCNPNMQDVRPFKIRACPVQVRFLYQMQRTLSPEMVFAQMYFAFLVTREMPDLVVGMNLVQAEDNTIALRDYTLQMQMLKFLRKELGGVRPRNISLHAGELTEELLPENTLFPNNHIAQAVEIAGANRIGHGVDIRHELDRDPFLLEKMRQKDILVEINLTSNQVILEVTGQEHPVRLYRQRGVPIALSTDDEGVLRINLTHEYVKAVLEHGFGYNDLKRASRNSLTYSFLPGESIWQKQEKLPSTKVRNSQPFILASDCNVETITTDDKVEKCKSFLMKNNKALVQIQLEKRFQLFEEQTFTRSHNWPFPKSHLTHPVTKQRFESIGTISRPQMYFLDLVTNQLIAEQVIPPHKPIHPEKGHPHNPNK